MHGRRGRLRPGRPRRWVPQRGGRAPGRWCEAAPPYLNSPAAADLDGAARGEALEELGAITSLLGAAANGLLRRFNAGDGHDADGYASAPRGSPRKTTSAARTPTPPSGRCGCSAATPASTPPPPTAP